MNEVHARPVAHDRFEIELGGRRVRVPPSFDAEALPRMLAALEEAVIPAVVRIFVCTERVDMREGFDRLMLAAREKTQYDPQRSARLHPASPRGESERRERPPKPIPGLLSAVPGVGRA
jgi:transposase